MVRPAVSVLVLLLAAACAPAAKPVDTAADEKAIRTIDDSWNGYIASHNDSAIAAIYAADAVFMPPNMPAITGSDAIRQFWAGLWPLNATLKLTVRDIVVSGDLAVETGLYSFSIPGPAGATNDNGKYLVAWRREAGGWKAFRDIYNSDNAPPAPAK